ncbi:nucleotidyltransferase domain-containing protein [Paraglaciecola aquimarina]|uniref:Nucleotidyltransferase domain-containing protein n=1 Tax=Paraglaciecola algarum TaxID=3050085 RepID=A0ABS9D8R4_9ALTE|nr:nucleotidyltransferase domain-containing protein [Paraglaciecola sp. G1-23]
MNYGLPQQTLDGILAVLAEYQCVEQAILYGSRAKGNYRPGSDIDVALKGALLNMPSLYEIMDKLEQLDLPYEIDLSLYSQIENTSLLEHIERVGQVIYQRD